MSDEPSTSKPLAESVVEQLTNEFVELFAKDDSNYEGVFGRLMLYGELPEGVDDRDPRVFEIFQEVVARGLKRLDTRAIEIEFRMLCTQAAKTYPDSKFVACSICYLGDSAGKFYCEFFFEGPKKFERDLPMDDLKKEDGRDVATKLADFVDTSVVDAMKTGC